MDGKLRVKPGCFNEVVIEEVKVSNDQASVQGDAWLLIGKKIKIKEYFKRKRDIWCLLAHWNKEQGKVRNDWYPQCWSLRELWSDW